MKKKHPVLRTLLTIPAVLLTAIALVIAIVTLDIPANLIDRTNAQALSAASWSNARYDESGYVVNDSYISLYMDSAKNSSGSIASDDYSMPFLDRVDLYEHTFYPGEDGYEEERKAAMDSHNMFTSEIADIWGWLGGSSDMTGYTPTAWEKQGDRIVATKREVSYVQHFPMTGIYDKDREVKSVKVTIATFAVKPPEFMDIHEVATNPRADTAVALFDDDGWSCITDASCATDSLFYIGCCNVISKVIQFRDSQIFKANRLVAYHELGHLLDYEAARQHIGLGVFTASTSPEWLAIYGRYKDGCETTFSDYETSSPIELFAGAYAQYVLYPKSLEEKFPDIYEYVEWIDLSVRETIPRLAGTERPEPESEEARDVVSGVASEWVITSASERIAELVMSMNDFSDKIGETGLEATLSDNAQDGIAADAIEGASAVQKAIRNGDVQSDGQEPPLSPLSGA